MKIIQSTLVRFHHFDLARELHSLGHLERVFTCLPWWLAAKESRQQNIPRHKITCNFLYQGIRRVGWRMPGFSTEVDRVMAKVETKLYSRWVAQSIGECDAYIGISSTGLHAGRKVKSQGGGYIMDRGSTQIRHQDRALTEEFRRWNLRWTPIDPWIIANEEAEADEAHLITVPSTFVRDTFINEGTPADKLRVVPYGVSFDEFHPAGEPEPGTFRLVFVGQFSIRKGAPYLLQAFRQFNHPAKELVVVGAVAEEMHSLIQQLGSEGVRFVGMVPRSEVKQYLSTAHAMVLPSLEEGLALVQGQALACGCPVIATPNTGSRDLFTHEKEGLIVEARSVESLVAAFQRLADDAPLRESMRFAAIERVKHLGGWKTYGKSMLAAAEESRRIAQGDE